MQIIEIINLVIRVATIFVVYKLLKKMVDRIKELEEKLDNTQYKARYVENELNRHKRLNDDQYRQFQMLVHLLDMKIKTDWLGKTTIEKLTESEKIAKKLRQEADELECEE